MRLTDTFTSASRQVLIFYIPGSRLALHPAYMVMTVGIFTGQVLATERAEGKAQACKIAKARAGHPAKHQRFIVPSKSSLVK